MNGQLRLSMGLAGRILLVLLVAVICEFAASTLLYERNSAFSWREDEARRLAEHLVIARKLLAERPPSERPAIAEELTTDRYDVNWSPRRPARADLPVTSELLEMQTQILAWEAALRGTNLHLGVPRFNQRTTVVGALQLPDGTWVNFAAHGSARHWDVTIGRIVIAAIPALGLLIIGSLVIRRMLQPLQHLAEATEKFGGTEAAALPEEGTQEVRRVIRAFNEMQARIHRMVADRIHALAAVSHDLRTPLSRIQFRLDGIRDTALRDEIEADVSEIEGMIASLLAFIGGEDDPERPQRIDLAVLASTIASSAEDRGANATYTGPDHCETEARPIAMRRAITNLVDNAVHYGGAAEVSLREEPGEIVLAVEDRGPGIPEDSLHTVLEPFVRLDAARQRNTQGLGLGLSIVARTIELEGGRLLLHNRDGGGLSAELRMPRG